MAEIRRGIPTTCRCGESVILQTSRTTNNPGRLFYTCLKGTEGDRWRHVFKWVDTSMVEEIEDLVERVDHMDGDAMAMQKSLNACLDEVESLASEIKKSEEAVMKSIRDCEMEIRSLKNILVAIGVVVVIYYFLI